MPFTDQENSRVATLLKRALDTMESDGYDGMTPYQKQIRPTLSRIIDELLKQEGTELETTKPAPYSDETKNGASFMFMICLIVTGMSIASGNPWVIAGTIIPTGIIIWGIISMIKSDRWH